MSEEFGSGIALDEQFDLSVGATGDLETVSGVEELQKDLSFQLTQELQEYLGSPSSSSLVAQVSNTTKNVLNADSRIDSVNSESISVSIDSANRNISISVTAVASGEVQELVFNI